MIMQNTRAMPHPDKVPPHPARDNRETAPESTRWTNQLGWAGSGSGRQKGICGKLEPEKSVGAQADLGLNCAEISRYFSVKHSCVQELM
ncbi:hypothetical protein [Leisingera sp.]|uniref:hypothetical protein n=1 Tax=Leisingera sp. TaxID=1879318 RepID=UPI002B266CCC|nr:hypothetical protein [Leisingera sp.]